MTFAIGNAVIVRFRDPKTNTIAEHRLPRSSSSGTPTTIVIDRQAVARALVMRCLTMRITANKPIVFEGDDTRLISLPLDASLALEPGKSISNTSERRMAVRHETNGHPPNPGDSIELLAMAEELRTALAAATAKASVLIAALKSRKKERKALTQVWSSLQALNLGSGDQP